MIVKFEVGYEDKLSLMEIIMYLTSTRCVLQQNVQVHVNRLLLLMQYCNLIKFAHMFAMKPYKFLFFTIFPMRKTQERSTL